MIGIYKITSPSGKIYIGSSKNLERREKDYYYKRLKSQIKLQYSVNKYGWDNHTFEIIEQCDFNALNIRERYWQEFYNCVDKGLNCVYTKTNTKMKVFGKDVIDKMKANMQKRIRTNTQPGNKAVLQYDLEGNFIKEWVSITSIKKELGFSKECIIRCCKERTTSTWGYVWKYKTENEYPLKIYIPQKEIIITKQLIKYNKDMNELIRYNSLREASIETTISKGAILNNIAGLSKSAGGFIWKYEQLNN